MKAVLESHVDGSFEGSGSGAGREYRLSNGLRWRQVGEPVDEGAGDHPRVVLLHDGSGFYLRFEGIARVVPVELSGSPRRG